MEKVKRKYVWKDKESSQTRKVRNCKRLTEKAQLAGQSTYQGKPCPHGHDGIRYACNGSCVQCNRQSYRDFAKSRTIMAA